MNINNSNSSGVFLPNCIVCSKTEDPNTDTFTFGPITHGFGHSIGTCLRRTLLFHCLSVSPVKIKVSGCAHEYDVVPGIKQDMLAITSALRSMPVAVGVEFNDLRELSITLPAEAKTIRCKDLPRVSGLEFPDDDYVLFETTGTNTVSMNVWFACGRASDTEALTQEKIDTTNFDLSTIDVIPLFKPIDQVAVSVTSQSKGRKKFDSLALTITTDGSISPTDALNQARAIYFNEVASGILKLDVVTEGDAAMSGDISAHTASMSLRRLGLSPAIAACLEQIGLETVYDVINLPLHVIEETPALTDVVLRNINAALQRKHKDLYLKFFAEDQQAAE